jgi:hypothetical protein
MDGGTLFFRKVKTYSSCAVSRMRKFTKINFGLICAGVLPGSQMAPRISVVEWRSFNLTLSARTSLAPLGVSLRVNRTKARGL